MNDLSIIKKAVIETLAYFSKYRRHIEDMNQTYPTQEGLELYLRSGNNFDFETLPDIFRQQSEYDLAGVLKELKNQLNQLLDAKRLFDDAGIYNDINFYKIEHTINLYCLICYSYLFHKQQYDIYNNQPNGKPKLELTFNDFFNKVVSNKTITAIKKEFKELEGKELAILIYLLHKQYQIIEILTNSKTKGRKGFVKCLKDSENPAMQKINKCFLSPTDELIYDEKDLLFKSIDNRLSKIIEN